MSRVSEQQKCPKCAGPIPPEAPQGLCPKCLLAEVSIPTEAGQPSKSLPPSTEELAVAFPQLEILELIGQGGMGFVFKARQPKLDRFVALKILPQALAADPAFAERFTREGRVLARLNHPNIVSIHDFGQANGFFYLLMEFVDGVNLRQAMGAGRFTPDQALAIVPKICEALQYAHNEGILHRDIKPENILLDAKGRVKIADFGIAKLVGEVQRETQLTATGGTLGTPHYMAPEQIEKPSAVDHRADIYSLGVVFYEMLTGELPLGRFAPPSHKSNSDPRLDDIVFRTLEKEPARRPQNVSEVKTEVETIVGRPPVAAPPGVHRPAPVTNRFSKRLALVVLALIAIPAGLIFAWLLVYMLAQQKERLQSPATTGGFLSAGDAGQQIAGESSQSVGEDAAQTVAGSPPVVVSTQPVSGARDVEPGLTEIRVRFSKKMADGSWSWSTAWEGSPPEIVGNPRFESDGRTCVVNVKLEPKRTYAFWLNSEKFKNFTDEAGRPAVPYLLIFQTKEK